MKKSIFAFLLLVSLLTCFSSVIFTNSYALDTSFKAQLSGDEYGIIGEKYIVNLEIGNFTKEEFLGATAYIDYDASVFEIDSSYLAIINGAQQAENGASAETYPLVNPEHGWAFWGKNEIEGTNGSFMVNVLSDGSSISALECDSINCFVEFRVKADASAQASTFEIQTDSRLVGVFSETLIEAAYGEGSSLSVDILAEKPIEESELILNTKSNFIISTDAFVGYETLKGFRIKSTVSEVLQNFDNNSNSLRVVSGDKELKSTDFVTTGNEIQFYVDGRIVDSVIAVCIGDVDSSGYIDSTDYLSIKSHFLKKKLIDGIRLSAADIDNNSVIDSTDYIALKTYFFGKYDIYA